MFTSDLVLSPLARPAPPLALSRMSFTASSHLMVARQHGHVPFLAMAVLESSFCEMNHRCRQLPCVLAEQCGHSIHLEPFSTVSLHTTQTGLVSSPRSTSGPGGAFSSSSTAAWLAGSIFGGGLFCLVFVRAGSTRSTLLMTDCVPGDVSPMDDALLSFAELQHTTVVAFRLKAYLLFCDSAVGVDVLLASLIETGRTPIPPGALLMTSGMGSAV